MTIQGMDIDADVRANDTRANLESGSHLPGKSDPGSFDLQIKSNWKSYESNHLGYMIVLLIQN